MKRLPIIRKIDNLGAPELVFELVSDKNYSFFLDSSLVSRKWGRYSIIGWDPWLVLKAKKDLLEINQNGKVFQKNADPFETLREYLKNWSFKRKIMNLPFVGGCVGYLSYDLGSHLVGIDELARKDVDWPDYEIAFYDTAIIFDHLKKESYVCSTGFPEISLKDRLRRAEERLEEFLNIIQKRLRLIIFRKNEPIIKGDFKSSFTKQSYCSAVEEVKRYIKEGSVYVLNLAQHFSFNLEADAWELYKKLRQISPTNYSAFLNFEDVKVLSVSPECFLKVEGSKAVTKPIKGTRPRGRCKEKDLKLRNELRSDEKEKAELSMIVDLERNDFSRVCVPGSVRVKNLYKIEKYANVFQMTATVEGLIDKKYDMIDLLKATFPGGSITGAPKISAMKIIESLEPVRRGPYTGSLGFISFNGNSEFNILIRTIFLKEKKAYVSVGSGITVDSNPESEYIETLYKAKPLFSALGATELWNELFDL